jgi:hypothetical protein
VSTEWIALGVDVGQLGQPHLARGEIARGEAVVAIIIELHLHTKGTG